MDIINIYGWKIILIWFVVQIIVHELGHYLAYLYYGIKPKFKLNWWGIQIGTVQDQFKLIPYQFIIIGFIGILTGYIFTIFTLPKLIYIYLSMCIFDIVAIIQTIDYIKIKNISIGELQYQELKNIRDEVVK